MYVGSLLALVLPLLTLALALLTLVLALLALVLPLLALALPLLTLVLHLLPLVLPLLPLVLPLLTLVLPLLALALPLLTLVLALLTLVLPLLALVLPLLTLVLRSPLGVFLAFETVVLILRAPRAPLRYAGLFGLQCCLFLPSHAPRSAAWVFLCRAAAASVCGRKRERTILRSALRCLVRSRSRFFAPLKMVRAPRLRRVGVALCALRSRSARKVCRFGSPGLPFERVRRPSLRRKRSGFTPASSCFLFVRLRRRNLCGGANE